MATLTQLQGAPKSVSDILVVLEPWQDVCRLVHGLCSEARPP